LVVATTDKSSNENFNWLNAYNAPHSVDVYAALPVTKTIAPLNRFSNGANNIEAYATSWIYDLLQAWRQTQQGFEALSTADQEKVLITGKLRSTG
jgi:hypothetical protein